ncbi:hypothetical protein FRC07_009221, partial [Ceratobasidium sp. 392]
MRKPLAFAATLLFYVCLTVVMVGRINVGGRSSVKGVLTNRDMMKYKFGVVDHVPPILCCLECPTSPCRLLTLSNCSEHFRDHAKDMMNRDSDEERDVDDKHVPIALRRIIKIPTAPEILKVLDKYEFWRGSLHDIPIPQEPSPKLHFLDEYKGFRCKLCEAQGRKFIGRSIPVRRKHFLRHHETSVDMTTNERAVTVQTFDNSKTYRNDFEISMAQTIAETRREQAGPKVDPQRLSSAWIRQAKPLSPAKLTGPVNVKTANPFVARSGWGEYLAKFKDLKAARTLAHGPYTKNERALYKKALSGVQNEFGITFTKGQAEWVDYAIKYCDGRPAPDEKRILYDFSRHLWSDNDTHFQHMLRDSFNDLTTAYSIFYTLREDLTLPLSLDVTHDLNAIRFAMRQVFLFSTLSIQERKGHSSVWVEDALKNNLDRTRTGPFCNISDAISLAFEIAATAEALPNVVYEGTGDEAVATVRGKPVIVGDWKRAVQQLVQDLETFVDKKLLFGIKPDALGFDFGPGKKIFDDHANTTPGYSYINDTRNPFHEWRFNLASALFSNPKASGLFADDLDDEGKVQLKEAGIDNWLTDYAFATRQLALAVNFVSGQPSRGVEFSLVRLINEGWRVRNIYYMGNGRIAIVLFYTKTSSITGKDRVVAHCVPWRIAKLMITMDALIRPFACQALDIVAGEEARRIQETFEFALRGQMNQSPILSADLRDFFESALDVSIGLRDYRHLAIVVMRHELLEFIGPSERALAVVDLQAGHGSAIAGKHYAVEIQKAYKIDSELLSAFFVCSGLWFKFMMGTDGLTETDLRELASHVSPIEQAKRDRAMQIGAVSVNPGLTKQDVQDMLNENQRAFVERAEKQNVDTLALIKSHLASTQTRAQAPAVVVTQFHRTLLSRFLQKTDATWSSLVQGRAFARVLGQQQSVLAVMRTGGGKSLLFQLPASIELGITL